MRGTKQVSAFTTKLSEQLGKFKDNSTIAIAHQQIKKLFAQYSFPEIITQFINKMDNSDRLSDREKKQYAKIYISIIDTYGPEVLYQQYYEKLMDSLVKKTIGVGEVIGYLCKTLLSRIHPPQNTVDYINHILTVFRSHNDISKIIRNIVQSLDSTITTEFQGEMMSILTEKMTNKAKLEPIQAILSLVLTFEEQFEYESVVQNIVLKNYKNQDYNVRKVCVDICYALLVVKSEANGSLHRVVKQLKYDKIKHVREAVSNYNVLYKQLYGEQEQKKGDKRQSVPQRVSTGSAEVQQNPMNKSFKSNQRNQTFFKNAKNSNVIKVPDEIKQVSPVYQSQPQYEQYPPDDDQQDQQQYEEEEEYKQEVPVNPLRESLPKQFIQKLTQPQGNQNPIEQNRNFQKYLKKRQKQYYEATHKVDQTNHNSQHIGKQINLRQIDKLNKKVSRENIDSKLVDTPKNSDRKSLQGEIKYQQLNSLKQMLTGLQKAIIEKLSIVQAKTTETQQRMTLIEKKIQENTKMTRKGQSIIDVKQSLKNKLLDIENKQNQQTQQLYQLENCFKKQIQTQHKQVNIKLNLLTDELIQQKSSFKKLITQLIQNINNTPKNINNTPKVDLQPSVDLSKKSEQNKLNHQKEDYIKIQTHQKQQNMQQIKIVANSQEISHKDQSQITNTEQKQKLQHLKQDTPIQKLGQFMNTQPNITHQQFNVEQEKIPAQKNQSLVTEIKQESELSKNQLKQLNKKEIDNSPNIYDQICDIKIQNSSHEVHYNEQQDSEDESQKKDLDEKLKQSIQEQNWDEAFSIVLGNSNEEALLKLLEQEEIPEDKVVQECLLMAIRKLLTKCQTLQWLNNYLRQRTMTKKHLKKFKADLQKVQFEDNGSKQARNYIILRSMVSKQIQTQLNGK